MKQLVSLFLALLTLTATAQINYPFNPDENADAFISTPDLMEFLVVFGYEWEQEEIQVDSIPLSMYLSSLEAMIEATALPEGTMLGQFLQWDGESWNLVIPKDGCTLPEACNYDPTAHVLDEDKCILQDECGVCNGPGAIYDCGCSDIPEGDCDCEGNVVDALGACGGTCAADEDGDGICDDGDSCVGEADECGVCNGPGAIYGCGCSDIPEGACDCNGNVLDAIGTCGGACQNDINGDGICDDSIHGCIYSPACNYDPSATINDGSCDFTSCVGCTDPLACNYNPDATQPNDSCWYPDVIDCDGSCVSDSDLDGVCDSDEIFGCTDESACNFNYLATELDGSCNYPGCIDNLACNFNPEAGCDDGSCVVNGLEGCTDLQACNFNSMAICDDGSCTFPGCTFPNASNFNSNAGCSDNSCIISGCTEEFACNYDIAATVDDGSCQFTTCAGCSSSDDINYNPTSENDSLCGFSWVFNNCGQEGAYGPLQSMCDLTYDWSVSVSQGVQSFEIEQTGTYEMELFGAWGGKPNGLSDDFRGKGARVLVSRFLSAGQILHIVIGQEGGANTGGNAVNGGGSGGGGTFVWVDESIEPIAVAGGGGGSSIMIVPFGGNTEYSRGRGGNDMESGLPSWSLMSNQGTAGNDASQGAAAKGWNSMRASLDFSGQSSNGFGDSCGFGGGGDGLNGNGAGGGGGYSGGGNSAWGDSYNSDNGFTYQSSYGGGGGGSYASYGVVQAGVHEGHGELILRLVQLTD